MPTKTDKAPRICVVYTRDRHPVDHCSFQSQGGIWPVHCVDQTTGFELYPKIVKVPGALFVDKGTLQNRDAYSGFDGTNLAETLRTRGIEHVAVAGLATDYCVKATTLDALREGFLAWLLCDASAAVDLRPGDGQRACLAMLQAGARLSNVGQFTTVLDAHPRKCALIVVDVQNDFCPGGALAVTGADAIFGPLNRLLQHIASAGAN